MERLESIGSPAPATLLDVTETFLEGKAVIEAETGCACLRLHLAHFILGPSRTAP